MAYLDFCAGYDFNLVAQFRSLILTQKNITLEGHPYRFFNTKHRYSRLQLFRFKKARIRDQTAFWIFIIVQKRKNPLDVAVNECLELTAASTILLGIMADEPMDVPNSNWKHCHSEGALAIEESAQ